MIRKNAVIILISIILTFLGGFLLLNLSLKSIIEKQSRRILKQNVTLKSASITLSPLGLSLKGLTSKSKNGDTVLSIEDLSGGVNLVPLLYGCIVVDDIAIQGVRYITHTITPNASAANLLNDTPKETSVSPNPLAQLHNENAHTKSKLGALDKVGKNASVKNLIDYDNLPSTRKRAEVEAQINKAAQNWEPLLNKLQFQPRQSALQSKVDEIKVLGTKGLSSLSEVKKRYDFIATTYKEGEALYKDTQAYYNSLNAQINDINQQINDLKTYTSHDLNYAKKQLDFSQNGVEKVGQLLFGADMTATISNVLHWISVIRNIIPDLGGKFRVDRDKKDEVILFKNKRPYPRLWIKKINIKGDNPTPQQRINGQILNISSDQEKSGAITKLFLKTSNILNRNELTDTHATYSQKDKRLVFTSELTQGIENKLLLSNDTDTLRIKHAQNTITTQMQLSNKGLNGSIDAVFKNCTLNPVSGDIMGALAATLESMDSIELKAKISGTEQAPIIGISSNIDQVFAKAIQKYMDNQRTKIETQIQAEVTKQITQYQNELNKRVNDTLKPQLDQLDKFKSVIDNNLKQIK